MELVAYGCVLLNLSMEYLNLSIETLAEHMMALGQTRKLDNSLQPTFETVIHSAYTRARSMLSLLIFTTQHA